MHLHTVTAKIIRTISIGDISPFLWFKNSSYEIIRCRKERVKYSYYFLCGSIKEKKALLHRHFKDRCIQFLATSNQLPSYFHLKLTRSQISIINFEKCQNTSF